ncbi:MAG: hypothetical protein KDA21_06955, partial [Phycisphaerales bacterium]|nr:hypothetical protein [Phycisphaerales bacterium]
MKFDSTNPYVISNGAIHFGDLSTVAAGAMVTHTFNSEVWVDAGSTWSINELAPVEVAGLFRPTGTPSEPFPSETEPMTKGGAGTLIISGDNGNVYTHVIVISGEVILRNGDALPDVGQLEIKPGATLTMEDDETIGTLWNQGHVALGSNTLRLAGTLFAETRGISGTVTGDANSRLVMAATGSSLTENILGSVQVGRVDISGGTMGVSVNGTITLPDVSTSDIRVNGAQSVFQVSNGGTVLMPTVASLTQPNGRGIITDGATMTISQSGSVVSGGRIDIGIDAAHAGVTVSDNGLLDISLGQSPVIVVGVNESGPGEGALTVESGGAVQTKRLFVGVLPDNAGSVSVSGAGSTLVADDASLGGVNQAQFGGVATLSVSDGGAVTLAGGTLDIFTDACSVIVDGGVLSTMIIDTVGSASPTMALSDPAGGSALRLGDDELASITTIDFPVSDAAGGPGSIQKIGLGSLLLAHGGTYSGGVTVTGGRLRLLDAARQFPSLTGSGPVLFTGLRLEGTGVIAGTLSVAGSGVLAPSQESGAGIDLIECGALNLGAGTTTEIQLGGVGSFDQVDVEGEASLGGMLTLSYQGGFTAAPGDWFEIIDA